MMASKTFKKVSVVKLSADFAEATKVVEVSLTPPQDDQILLKVLYSGVNATDINISAGRYWTDGVLPFDVGLEAIGVIESVGSRVSLYRKGQYAIFYTTYEIKPRAFAEYIYVKPEEIFLIPEPKPEFIALLVCGLTAAIGLDLAGKVTKDDKVLITAASGGTGHIAVQWAKRSGAHVIGLTSTQEKANVLTELGVDRVINYKQENIDEVLTKEYPNGVDVVWETIGGKVFETLFKHLAIKGRLVVIGGIDGYKSVGFSPISVPNLTVQILMKSQTIIGFASPLNTEYHKEYFKKLSDLVLNNELKIILDFGHNSANGPFESIDHVVSGVEHLHSGKNIGKVVVKLNQ